MAYGGHSRYGGKGRSVHSNLIGTTYGPPRVLKYGFEAFKVMQGAFNPQNGVRYLAGPFPTVGRDRRSKGYFVDKRRHIRDG